MKPSDVGLAGEEKATSRCGLSVAPGRCVETAVRRFFDG